MNYTLVLMSFLCAVYSPSLISSDDSGDDGDCSSPLSYLRPTSQRPFDRSLDADDDLFLHSDNDDDFYKHPIMVSSSDDDAPPKQKSVEEHQAKFSRAVERARTRARTNKKNRGIDLRGVNLTGADLTGADLTDAILTDASMGRTNLKGVKGLRPDQLQYARKQGALNVPGGRQTPLETKITRNSNDGTSTAVMYNGFLDNRPLSVPTTQRTVETVFAKEKQPRKSWCSCFSCCNHNKDK